MRRVYDCARVAPLSDLHADSRSARRRILPVAVIGSARRRPPPAARHAARAVRAPARSAPPPCPSDRRAGSRSTTKALTASVRIGSGTPTTAAIATSGCAREALLDLAGSDPVARRGDHVVGAGAEDARSPPRPSPPRRRSASSRRELLRRPLRVVPVAEEHHRIGAPHRDLAGLARRAPARPSDEDRHLVPGHRPPGDAGPHRQAPPRSCR